MAAGGRGVHAALKALPHETLYTSTVSEKPFPGITVHAVPVSSPLPRRLPPGCFKREEDVPRIFRAVGPTAK